MTHVEKFEKEFCKMSELKHILNCHLLLGNITKSEREDALKTYRNCHDAAKRMDALSTGEPA